MKAFTKPALSYADQLAVLKKRGLAVDDDDFALRRLRHIGYYRLSGYMLPFQRNDGSASKHDFNAGTTFRQVVRLYVFDRRLRLVFLDALDRIEISVRAALSGEIAVANGPFWYTNAGLFDSKQRVGERTFIHADYIAEIKKQLEKITDVFIEHYYTKYNSPDLPPCWMLFECMSFGVVSKTIKHLIPRNAAELLRDYGVSHDVLTSWLHCISYVRNLCAHQSRLWNRGFIGIKPKVAHLHRAEMALNNKLYAQAVIVMVMLNAITANDVDWAKKLASLFDEFPEVPIGEMGFPANWRERPLWKAALA